MRRFFSVWRRGCWCSAAEGDVISEKDLEGVYPINAGVINSQNYTIDTVTDFDDLFDEDGDDNNVDADDTYPWSPANDVSSPSSLSKKSKRKRGWTTLAYSKSHTQQRQWQKLADNDDDAVEMVFFSPSPEAKPTAFNVTMVESKAFQVQRNQEVSVVTQTQQSQHHQPPGPILPVSSPISDDNPKGQEIRQKDRRMKQVKEEDDDGDKMKTKPSYSMDFPVHEIKGPRTRAHSDVSSVSDLSEPAQLPLEFSLEKGFKGGDDSSFYRNLSEDIVRSLERTEYGQRLPVMQKLNHPKKCLILLMDPKKKLFEIVPIPYEPGKTTVGEMMAMLKELGTDNRLARQQYTGLAYQGMHVCAPAVPVDVLLDAETSRKPLIAVPVNYSAGQMELLGKSLLEMPSVSRLLEDQLARIDANRKQGRSSSLPASFQHHKVHTACT